MLGHKGSIKGTLTSRLTCTITFLATRPFSTKSFTAIASSILPHLGREIVLVVIYEIVGKKHGY
jgi:hypothetical protein